MKKSINNKKFKVPYKKRKIANSQITKVVTNNKINKQNDKNLKCKIKDAIISQEVVERPNERWQLLNGIKIGVGNYQRSSREILIHRITLKYAIEKYPDVNIVIPEHDMRLILIYDKQCNGTRQPLSNTIFSLDNDGNPYYSIWDGVGLPYLNRYEILYDQVWKWPFTDFVPNQIVQGTTNSGQAPLIQDVELHFDPPLLTVYSDLNSGDIGDIESGSLTMSIVGNWKTSDLQDPPIVLDGRARLYFTEVSRNN